MGTLILSYTDYRIIMLQAIKLGYKYQQIEEVRKRYDSQEISNKWTSLWLRLLKIILDKEFLENGLNFKQIFNDFFIYF